jgi:phosphoribosylaminoimidazole (AIR) synthetase
MGVGLIVVCGRAEAGRALQMLQDGGDGDATIIGRIVGGNRDVRYSS